MTFFDLDNFIKAAQAILRGTDPYALSDIYYPLPFYFFFIPLAILPGWLSHVVWTLCTILIFVAILRQRALSVMLFMPVLLTFVEGQVVMPMLGLFSLLRSRRFGGFALALLLLKPQLVFFLAPWLLWNWLKHDRRQVLVCAMTGLTLALIAFWVQPNWLVRWLAVSAQRNRALRAPSLWGLLSFLPTPVWFGVGVLLTLALFIWAWRQNDFDIIAAAGFLANPLIISYDLTLLTISFRETRIWLALTVLSWVTFAISAWQLNEGAVAFLTISVLIVLLLQKRKAVSLKGKLDESGMAIEQRQAG